MLSDLKNLIIATALSLGIGFAAGYYTEGRFAKADQTEEMTDARQQTARDIQTQLETDKAVEAKVAASDQSVAVIRRTAAKHLHSIETRHADLQNQPGISSAVPADRCWNLDRRTVGLLNSARNGTALDAADGTDAEGEAPSGIGLPELLDNDLEIVGLYHELATRHDALVDYVESLLKRQAEQ